jgi:serine protease Do
LVPLAAVGGLLLTVTLLPAQEAFTKTAEEVNKKMVKIYGAGGIKGLPSYGSGFLVAPTGFILTVNNTILNTNDIRIHLADGRVCNAKVVAREPELDLALLKIEQDVGKVPFFDVAEAIKKPMAETGDWILCHSNQFSIAVRNEPMSVQRGTIMAVAELRSRKGVFEPPYNGEVYFIDTVACNPGAAGGTVTNRKGELLGILGRELKSHLTDTWVNYAVPIQAKVDIVRDDGSKDKVDIARFVKEGMENKYRESSGKKKRDGKGAYHGIKLVHNAVSITPPYIDEVIPGSPAAKAKLQADDLIVYLDGELVQSIRQFNEIMAMTNPGQVMQMDVQRGNQLKTIKLTLEDLPKAK